MSRSMEIVISFSYKAIASLWLANLKESGYRRVPMSSSIQLQHTNNEISDIVEQGNIRNK